jgi:flagellar motor protein MotB
VVGRADQEHFIPAEPTSPRNRRISIVLLRQAPDGETPRYQSDN